MNTVWILILFTQLNGSGMNYKLTTQEFTSKSACTAAGNSTKRMVRNNIKEVKFTCEKK